ncbi:FAD-dependent oxidoreductase [Leucobacter sp. NPDC058333]|uniref:FAD-dependent oxidoreductase n=1 Tax=Leucobacter sp. NPDC058333 TaxID=3346450 RepID=UPI00364B8F58
MTPHPKIAIVGSGPAGCYLAQSLRRSLPDAELTVLDRAAAPYGLIRYGVAPDHQHTKAITRQFDRLFQSPEVRFVGGIDIDTDVTLASLREIFDVVVLATGLPLDRAITVPGAELAGVYAAGEIVRALNAHPEAASAQLPQLGTDVVVIGAGNVALDLVRFLVKDRSGYIGSDVHDAALEQYVAAPAQRVTVVSRSSAAESKGDPQMLSELATLPRASYAVTHAGRNDTTESHDDRTITARLAAIAALADPARGTLPGPTVSLRFGALPTRILGTEHVTGIELACGTETVTVPATAVITAIGFRPAVGAEATTAQTAAGVIASLPANLTTGRIERGLYRVGWAQRGPRGAIPENRASAKLVADEIVADLGARAQPSLAVGFAGLDAELRTRAIDFSQWLTLDAHERATAPTGRVRQKVISHTAMIDIARGGAHAAPGASAPTASAETPPAPGPDPKGTP